MGTKLPKALRYLSKAVSELDDQEQLNDQTDASVLREALLSRIAGMPEEKAQKRLDDDLEVLEQWIEASDEDVTAAHYVSRYMMKPGLARELLAWAHHDDEGASPLNDLA